MQVLNNTQQDVSYDVSWEGGGDCGNLGMGETFDNPDWDSHQTVEFSLFGAGAEPVPLAIEVGETDTGKTVTIGLYYE